MDISLADLYTAYRKAKKEAFSDTNCAHGLKFAAYEEKLGANLSRLRRILNQTKPKWQVDSNFLGSATCIPKSVTMPKPTGKGPTIHCQSIDPLEQWNRLCSSTNRATADFRPVIDASVDFMVIAALWILEVGHLYDEKLDTRYAVGNRLRRWRPKPHVPAGTPGELNQISPDLFQPYFTAYGKWRTAGLQAMRRELASEHRIVAVTMDLKRFYHQVDAAFLLHEDYLKEVGIVLTDDQRAFTQQMIDSFATWNEEANGQFRCEARGLPVGLTASSLIANVLLREFDRTVVSRLDPSYYARYVDDVFLVLRHSDPFPDGNAFLSWLGERLAPMVTARLTDDGDPAGDGPALQVNLPYADGSDLLFVGKKQKIFQLEGRHGVNLIVHIEEQIKKQTSEHRNLPWLPDTEGGMVHRALLVTPDATLDADALRKADAVTLRRSGFAMLLGDVEAHVRDLDPGSWTNLRHEFYGLAERHLLTPNAFFDYSRYFPRIVGIMATCGDWDAAERFVSGLKSLLDALLRTCRHDNRRLGKCLKAARVTLAARLSEAVLQSIPREERSAFLLLRNIRTTLSARFEGPKTSKEITTACKRLVNLDWSRFSYACRWLEATKAETSPARPKQPDVRAILPFEAIQIFRDAADLPRPYWPALAFPTRPIPLRELTARAPSLLFDSVTFSTVVRGLRGNWMPERHGLIRFHTEAGTDNFFIPGRNTGNPRIAITSTKVSDSEWAAAADGRPSLTLDRYRKLNAILDAVVNCRERPTHLILPECCLPTRWAMNMAGKVVSRGVSLIAGLEYREDITDSDALHNEVLVALQTTYPGYTTGLFFHQPKRQPAWQESRLLGDNHGKALADPSAQSLNHPVFNHRGFCFGILICSELTDIENRRRFQGQVDALFIPEWNQDVESFAALVESAALDVHAYIVQANNGRFGDSRMRAPMKVHYRRDLIRVKGGLNDYFVVGEINYPALRQFQSHAIPPTGPSVLFKPFPIGFPARLSPMRKTTPL